MTSSLTLATVYGGVGVLPGLAAHLVDSPRHSGVVLVTLGYADHDDV
jgi:hypothetical protein